MKLNPRKLALAGLIAVGASEFVYKIGISVIDPSSPEVKITIPFVESTVKHMEDGKITSITVSKNYFIPRFVSAYIAFFVAGSLYNRRKD